MSKPTLQPVSFLFGLLLLLGTVATALAAPGDVAVYFGTFDPPHQGHLAVALGAKKTLGVDRVLMVANRWARKKPGASDYSHRLAMTRALAYRFEEIEVPPAAEVDQACRQGGREGWVPRFREMLLAQMKPTGKLFHIMGMDSFNKFLSYRGWEGGTERLVIVVNDREGYSVDQDLLESWKDRADRVRYHDLGGVTLSSTRIRNAVRQGGEIAGLVPSVIARYIERNRLYRQD